MNLTAPRISDLLKNATLATGTLVPTPDRPLTVGGQDLTFRSYDNQFAEAGSDLAQAIEQAQVAARQLNATIPGEPITATMPYAVVQAGAGAFYTTPLGTNVTSDGDTRFIRMPIDGVMDRDGTRLEVADAYTIEKLVPANAAVRAIVGADTVVKA